MNQIKEEERNPDPTSCHPPKPYPTTLGYTSFITSVPKWKVRNNIEFLFKDVFKNYVLNHFLYWKERESCSSTDKTSVHIDHSIFAMGGLHVIYSQDFQILREARALFLHELFPLQFAVLPNLFSL